MSSPQRPKPLFLEGLASHVIRKFRPGLSRRPSSQSDTEAYKSGQGADPINTHIPTPSPTVAGPVTLSESTQTTIDSYEVRCDAEPLNPSIRLEPLLATPVSVSGPFSSTKDTSNVYGSKMHPEQRPLIRMAEASNVGFKGLKRTLQTVEERIAVPPMRSAFKRFSEAIDNVEVFVYNNDSLLNVELFRALRTFARAKWTVRN